MAPINQINTGEQDYEFNILSSWLATICLMAGMIFTLLGIKIWWFKHRLTFEENATRNGVAGGSSGSQPILKSVTTRDKRSSQQVVDSVVAHGIFRKRDEDELDNFERPKQLPPIRIPERSQSTTALVLPPRAPARRGNLTPEISKAPQFEITKTYNHKEKEKEEEEEVIKLDQNAAKNFEKLSSNEEPEQLEQQRLFRKVTIPKERTTLNEKSQAGLGAERRATGFIKPEEAFEYDQWLVAAKETKALKQQPIELENIESPTQDWAPNAEETWNTKSKEWPVESFVVVVSKPQPFSLEEQEETAEEQQSKSWSPSYEEQAQEPEQQNDNDKIWLEMGVAVDSTSQNLRNYIEEEFERVRHSYQENEGHFLELGNEFPQSVKENYVENEREESEAEVESKTMAPKNGTEEIHEHLFNTDFEEFENNAETNFEDPTYARFDEKLGVANTSNPLGYGANIEEDWENFQQLSNVTKFQNDAVYAKIDKASKLQKRISNSDDALESFEQFSDIKQISKTQSESSSNFKDFSSTEQQSSSVRQQNLKQIAYDYEASKFEQQLNFEEFLNKELLNVEQSAANYEQYSNLKEFVNIEEPTNFEQFSSYPQCSNIEETSNNMKQFSSFEQHSNFDQMTTNFGTSKIERYTSFKQFPSIAQSSEIQQFSNIQKDSNFEQYSSFKPNNNNEEFHFIEKPSNFEDDTNSKKFIGNNGQQQQQQKLLSSATAYVQSIEEIYDELSDSEMRDFNENIFEDVPLNTFTKTIATITPKTSILKERLKIFENADFHYEETKTISKPRKLKSQQKVTFDFNTTEEYYLSDDEESESDFEKEEEYEKEEYKEKYEQEEDTEDDEKEEEKRKYFAKTTQSETNFYFPKKEDFKNNENIFENEENYDNLENEMPKIPPPTLPRNAAAPKPMQRLTKLQTSKAEQKDGKEILKLESRATKESQVKQEEETLTIVPNLKNEEISKPQIHHQEQQHQQQQKAAPSPRQSGLRPGTDPGEILAKDCQPPSWMQDTAPQRLQQQQQKAALLFSTQISWNEHEVESANRDKSVYNNIHDGDDGDDENDSWAAIRRQRRRNRREEFQQQQIEQFQSREQLKFRPRASPRLNKRAPASRSFTTNETSDDEFENRGAKA